MPNLSEYRWRKTDESVNLFHCPAHTDLQLFYARIYTIGQGFEFSETNQAVLNLKAPISNSKRRPYKLRAIEQCAREVSEFFTQSVDPTFSIVLVPIPPSKTRSHPEYDDRMEQVATLVAQRCSNVTWLPLLDASVNSESFHSRSDSRDPNEVYQLMTVNVSQIQFYNPASHIILLDDVLTSGSHFTAAREHLLELFLDAPIHGIFWAKAERVEQFSD
jgi:hypothetical protein